MTHHSGSYGWLSQTIPNTREYTVVWNKKINEGYLGIITYSFIEFIISYREDKFMKGC